MSLSKFNTPKLVWLKPDGEGRGPSTQIVEDDTWSMSFDVATADRSQISIVAGNKEYSLPTSGKSISNPNRSLKSQKELFKMYK